MLFMKQSKLKKLRFSITKSGEACSEFFKTRSHNDTEKHGGAFLSPVNSAINPDGIQAPLSFQTPVRIVYSVVQVLRLPYYI